MSKKKIRPECIEDIAQSVAGLMLELERYWNGLPERDEIADEIRRHLEDTNDVES